MDRVREPKDLVSDEIGITHPAASPGDRSPDWARVAVTAPAGWTFTALRPRARVKDATASWSGTLDREHTLEFALSR
jgi:hypothetical protein